MSIPITKTLHFFEVNVVLLKPEYFRFLSIVYLLLPLSKKVVWWWSFLYCGCGGVQKKFQKNPETVRPFLKISAWLSKMLHCY